MFSLIAIALVFVVGFLIGDKYGHERTLDELEEIIRKLVIFSNKP